MSTSRTIFSAHARGDTPDASSRRGGLILNNPRSDISPVPPFCTLMSKGYSGSDLAKATKAATTEYHGTLKQPLTIPITEEQLINKVSAVYSSLVMVEKEGIQLDQQRADSKEKLSNERGQSSSAYTERYLMSIMIFFSWQPNIRPRAIP